MKTARKIEIKGLVQGVGFRPFIYRLAKKYHLNGTVENNNIGVLVNVEGDDKNILAFIKELPSLIPEAASISKMAIADIALNNFADFSIVKSNSVSNEITEVSPDIGVCKACLDDMKTQAHRIAYPFTNCTNCGPRFTIIKDLPYDRHKTTMQVFEMCEICKKEYSDINDRRFHAQPVACNNCGPTYSLHISNTALLNIHEIILKACTLIESGKIIAMKGLGGYHLAANPFDEAVVSELRKRKNRDGKPFALMFKDLESAHKYLLIQEREEELLSSWRKPIVLLKTKQTLSPSVSIGLNTVGAMLPYLPFHYMIFEKLKIPAIILTSGNLSDEPILINDQEALKTLGNISEAVITNNREIYNRTDDSVAFVANNESRIIRRSRSYAPSPITLHFETEGIFAAGAELVNCFCIGKMNQAILSQHIGDLKNLETLEFYKESIGRYQRLFRFEPKLAVLDMHPDYLSSKFAAEMGIPFIEVQHHHAHIASCMAEHGLDEHVIGISFDGTGLGDDGNIWGGEFLLCNLENYERINHFEYIPQPGGDAANHHPWRMMLSYLYHYYGEKVVEEYPFLFEKIERQEIKLILSMLKNKINCPLSSSAGRLFDAVSALLGIVHNTAYHAEAPMRLEATATIETKKFYHFEIKKEISFKKTFEEMIADLADKVPISFIASKFHQTIVEVISATAKQIKKASNTNKVVLSGGTFQNRIILEKAEKRLKKDGFEVFSNMRVPSNDGGIALGQLAIAAKRRKNGNIS